MSHEEIQELLEAYVDDKLDRSTRKVVDDHLASCQECRAILDDVAPVDMGALGPMRYDERVLRRTMRRSMFRTAISAIWLLLAGLIIVWFASALLFQPLVINRGNRAAAAARAGMDVTTMINPGAVVTGGQIQSGFFDREMRFDAVMPVGGADRSLGEIILTVGALSTRTADGGRSLFFPINSGAAVSGDALQRLDRLGPGTVATVEMRFDHSIPITEAQALADSTDYDIRVTWAGFETAESVDQSPSWTAGGTLGYGTCLGHESFDDDLLGATSASFNRSLGSSPASVSGALESVQSALANLVDNPGLLADLAVSGADADGIARVAGYLEAHAMVNDLVLTGPSDELARFLTGNRPMASSSTVLAVDFYNWTTSVCGR